MLSLHQRQKVGALASVTDQTPAPQIKHLLTVNRCQKKKKKMFNGLCFSGRGWGKQCCVAADAEVGGKHCDRSACV